MKKAKIERSWSKHNLPSDLWAEVLSRLPVKSLLRLRCVAKSWRALIDDPDFCRLHLNSFNNNRDETTLFAVQEYRTKLANTCLSCVLRSSSTFRSLGNIDTSSLGDNWSVISSVDGLFMLQYNTPTKELVLWNPSIRRFRALLHPPTVPGATIILDLGFGFDPSIKDYKHVRLFLQDTNTLHSIAVYTVGTGTWKTAEFCSEVIYDWHYTSIFQFNRVQTVCFRGILYFIATKQNRVDKELVWFDLSREVFASTELPGKDDIVPGVIVRLIDSCGSLGLVYRLPKIRVSVWVLQGSGASIDSMYWTRHGYDYAPGRHICSFSRFLCLRKNRDLLLQRLSNEVVSHAFEASEEKILLKNTRGFAFKKVCGYVESLLLQGG